MSKIKNYADLEAEKLRLTALLRNHEEAIKADVVNVKEGLRPMSNALNVMNKIATRDNRVPVMNFGVEMGIDLLVRRVLLGRAGWFAKIVVPYLVKNYTSHFLGDEKKQLLASKIRNFFNKLRPKPNTVKTEIYRAQPAP
ncbi:MAG TPA: hypothetical protein VM010_01805 [Chitinophagaceae bacterium]|nr:hypothetical protein [Chitinophagaceae bacterium]